MHRSDRDKIPPARPKTWNSGRFACAGRVLSRFGCGHDEQGEFCPGLGVGALNRESFVPVSVSLRKIGRVASRHRPIGGRAVACEIGGEVSDRLWRGSWARRCGRGRPRTGDQHTSGSVVPQPGHRW